MVSEGPITFLSVLPLQITSRVANVDDNSLTYNRPSQKITSEMHAQLVILLPLKEFFSIYKFSNVTDSSCKQFRIYISLCRWFIAAKFPAISLQAISINCSEEKKKKIRIVNRSILSS